MKHKTLLLLLFFIFSVGIVLSYTPPSNMDGRNFYSIYNFTNISAVKFYQNGSLVLDTSSTITSTALNWTGLENYPVGCDANQAVRIINDTLTCTSNINESSYWDNLNTPSDISISDLDSTGEVDLNVNQSNYWDELNTPADIQISDLDSTGEADLNVNKSLYWDDLNSPSDFATDSVAELAIDMNTACPSGNHLYVVGNNFACEASPGAAYDADEITIYELTNTFYWNQTWASENAVVNQSDYWDDLNTPNDITDLDSDNINSLNLSKINNAEFQCSTDTYITNISASGESVVCTGITDNWLDKDGDTADLNSIFDWNVGNLTNIDLVSAVDGTYSNALSSVTLNTGQGNNELYDMDQNVLQASSPTFAGTTLTDDLKEDANINMTSVNSRIHDATGNVYIQFNSTDIFMQVN